MSRSTANQSRSRVVANHHSGEGLFDGNLTVPLRSLGPVPSIESRQRHAQTNLAHEDRAQEGSSCEFLHSKGFLEAVGAAHPDDRCPRIPAGTLSNARLDARTYRIELVITRSGRRSSRQTWQRPAGVKLRDRDPVPTWCTWVSPGAKSRSIGNLTRAVTDQYRPSIRTITRQ
ncbi:hypothetical protein KTR9_5293 (plasmid) [Gordonia sp. KTR9]|nr:hypothetical protein KTR9_5293 [Gordonia sp. KTR9]